MSRSLMHAALALLMAASLAISPLYAQGQQAPAPDTQSQTQPQMQTPPIYQPPALSPTPPPSPVRHLNFGPNYSNGHSWFPNITAPYTQMAVPQPDHANTPRIEQLIANGKLMLSLEDAVSLALENNLSVAVARYTPWLDEANLLYAKSGANGRLQFDPVLTGNFNLSNAVTPINNPFFAGVGLVGAAGAALRKTGPPSIAGHTFNANLQYTEGWATGTQAQVTFDNQRGTTTIPVDLFNPFVQTTLTIQITQPLLNGFGKIPNERYIIEAKNAVKVGESQFEQQVMSTITTVATDYWEFVFARENVKVEQVAVAADQQLYQNNKKQLEIGTMAPLDVITAQSQLASDQQALVQAQTTQLLDETTLLVAITKNPLAIEMKGVEIVPTTPLYSPNIEDISLEDAVKEAWAKRPELQQAALNLKNAGVEVKATKNALLPTLNLFGEYQANGLGGTEKESAPNGTVVPNLAAQILNGAGMPQDLFEPLAETSRFVFPGGLLDAWNRMITGQYPTIEGGLNLTLPIRNRAAQAQNATAQLNERQQEVQYQQTQNTIVLNVRQTLITLVQDKAAIAAAEQARVLAQQSYDDEVKRLQLGSSTAFTVVQKQQLLTSAQGTELRDRINLIEAQLAFDQAMGRTLEVHDITLADAMIGSVTTAPNIPGTPDTTGTASHR